MAKLLLVELVYHNRVPEFKFRVCSLFQYLADIHLGRQPDDSSNSRTQKEFPADVWPFVGTGEVNYNDITILILMHRHIHSFVGPFVVPVPVDPASPVSLTIPLIWGVQWVKSVSELVVYTGERVMKTVPASSRGGAPDGT